MNKNISVWRGNSTPPTDYHLWIKEDGSIHLKLNNEWKELLFENFSEVYESLKTDVESNITIINLIQTELETFFKDSDVSKDAIDTLKELQEYIEQHGKEASTVILSVNEITEKLNTVKDNLEKISVVQSTGESTTSIMSQNAVTKALASKVDTESVSDDLNEFINAVDYAAEELQDKLYDGSVLKWLYDYLDVNKVDKSELELYATTEYISEISIKTVSIRTLNTTLRRFTTALWNTYGTLNREENWSNVTNYADFTVGEYGVLYGLDTNTNEYVTLIGRVTSATSNGVKMVTVAFNRTSEQVTIDEYSVDLFEQIESAKLLASEAQTTANSAVTTAKSALSIANSKQDLLTFDTTPIENSTNPVTSGGVYEVLGNIESILNTIYNGTE